MFATLCIHASVSTLQSYALKRSKDYRRHDGSVPYTRTQRHTHTDPVKTHTHTHTLEEQRQSHSLSVAKQHF